MDRIGPAQRCRCIAITVELTPPDSRHTDADCCRAPPHGVFEQGVDLGQHLAHSRLARRKRRLRLGGARGSRDRHAVPVESRISPGNTGLQPATSDWSLAHGRPASSRERVGIELGLGRAGGGQRDHARTENTPSDQRATNNGLLPDRIACEVTRRSAVSTMQSATCRVGDSGLRVRGGCTGQSALRCPIGAEGYSRRGCSAVRDNCRFRR